MSEENHIYRRMTAHDAARIKRLTVTRGHYTNCRYYIKTSDRAFVCNKTGSNKKNCEGCMTCPNCGGLMFTFRIKKDFQRNMMYITHSKSCAICGAYIEEHMVGFAPKPQDTKHSSKCQVDGCTNTVYDGHIHEEAGQQFLICQKHKNRIKSWRQHPTKGEDQKPLVILAGRLIENATYIIKQGKRK